ncbi:MAG: CaiB/BaiF CoA transferase family protein [Hyphomicrobiaceae bacterium]
MTELLTEPLLKTVRVLELGHYIAAPFATRTLADLGADVIKVEPPGTGDPVRQWGLQEEHGSLWWSLHGRNKRSVTLNLRAQSARDIVLQLAANCDVIVENYRPGQLEKWGLTPAALQAARPGLVLVRISGHGQTGPRAGRAGFGVIGEAQGGVRYLCAHPPDVSDLAPVRAGVSFGDSIAGLYGALGALAAIIEQRAHGHKEVRIIDVALGESVVSLLEGILPEYGRHGVIREPAGSRIATASPSNAYRSKDGHWVLIAANSDRLFRALADVMGMPALADDERFVANAARLSNNDELDGLIENWVRLHSAEEVLEKLEEANIPASKIYSAADIAADPQYRARKMVTTVDDPLHGPLLHPGVVPVVAGLDRDKQIRWTGPAVGQHTAEVLREFLGMDEAELAALREEGTI